MTTPDPAAGPQASDPAEVAKFDEIAHRFWDANGEFRPLHHLNPVRFAYIAARAKVGQSRALDVGCGGGLLSESLVRGGARVTAIDLSPSMIETARLHAAEGGLEIDYRVQEAAALAADPASRYDIVCCMEMLEHVPDPAAMLATLGTLLAPAGSLFVSTLNRNVKSFLLAIVGAEYLLRLLPRGTHEYERFIRPSELARWAREAGLSLVDISGLRYEPFTGRSELVPDVSVNYIAQLRREH